MRAGSVFAKSVSRGYIMGHGVNAMTGSVQHMTGRSVVVSTSTDCLKWLIYDFLLARTLISQIRIWYEVWVKKTFGSLCPARMEAFDVPFVISYRDLISISEFSFTQMQTLLKCSV